MWPHIYMRYIELSFNLFIFIYYLNITCTVRVAHTLDRFPKSFSVLSSFFKKKFSLQVYTYMWWYGTHHVHTTCPHVHRTYTYVTRIAVPRTTHMSCTVCITYTIFKLLLRSLIQINKTPPMQQHTTIKIDTTSATTTGTIGIPSTNQLQWDAW